MLDYDVLDVFTDRPFAGNPLAVVRGAESLETARLQALAREFNLSETVFVRAPTPAERDEGADYGVRIFTPAAEIPFAGHPSVGAAWLLHRNGDLPAGSVGQACGAGVMRLRVGGDGPVELTAKARGISAATDAGGALTAVGLSAEDAASPLRVAGCGLDWAYVRVEPAALSRMVASPSIGAAVEPRPDGDPMGGLCVYALRSDDQPVQIRARVFCPDVGVLEDPATGSAALGLGIVLCAEGVLPPTGGAYVISQGREMNRPSSLYGQVQADDGVARECSVAGHVIAVAAGRIAIPPVS